jgi:hypothetical protein
MVVETFNGERRGCVCGCVCVEGGEVSWALYEAHREYKRDDNRENARAVRAVQMQSAELPTTWAAMR